MLATFCSNELNIVPSNPISINVITHPHLAIIIMTKSKGFERLAVAMVVVLC